MTMGLLALALSVASWIHVPGGTWQPTAHFAELRDGLEPFVTRAAAGQRKTLPAWSSYTFQYQGRTEQGRKAIFINAFCSPPPGDVKTQFVLVLDGGACYFRVKYDPAKKEFFDLEFNGEG